MNRQTSLVCFLCLLASCPAVAADVIFDSTSLSTSGSGWTDGGKAASFFSGTNESLLSRVSLVLSPDTQYSGPVTVQLYSDLTGSPVATLAGPSLPATGIAEYT